MNKDGCVATDGQVNPSNINDIILGPPIPPQPLLSIDLLVDVDVINASYQGGYSSGLSQLKRNLSRVGWWEAPRRAPRHNGP